MVGQITVRHARVRAVSGLFALERGRLAAGNSRVVVIAITSPLLARCFQSIVVNALTVADVTRVMGVVTLLGTTGGGGRGKGARGRSTGGASPGLLVLVTHNPELLLLDCSQLPVLFIRVLLVNDVTGVEFSLREHTSSSSVGVPVATGAGVIWASTGDSHQGATYRGYLAGAWGVSQAPLAVKAAVSLLNRLKGRVSLRGSNHIHLHDVKALVSDTLLEPEDLEVLGEGRNAIVREVSVEVVLLHVQLDVIVEGEVASVTLVLEGLKLT